MSRLPRRTTAAALILAGLAAAALASAPGERKGGEAAAFLEGSVMTYAIFEEAVAHADLPACPADLDPDRVFCRLTLANDAAHVFVFALEGDQPLLAVRHHPLDRTTLRF